MTLKQLTNEINQHLSITCSLPYQLPEPEVKRLVNRAKQWFYQNYGDAVEEKYIPLPIEMFEHPNFKGTRMLQMPDCIISVYKLSEVSGLGMIGNPDKDFSDSKLLGAEIFLSPFQGDNLVYRTAMYSYFDLAKAYLLETIAYKYNRNTKRISVLGRNPSKDCFIQCAVAIPEETLFDDELFIRYCLADAKISLGRMVSLFNFNLPGGITVNFDSIKQDGLTEMTDIKTQIDGENPPSWFIQWN